MLPNKKNLLAGLINFKTLTDIQTFSFDEFEKRAEELEKQHPGQGYQLSYNESLNQVFRAYAEKCQTAKGYVEPLNEIVEYFDTYLIKKYLTECEKQGVDVRIRTSENGISAENLNAFSDTLGSIPVNNVLIDTYKKFKSGELDLDSVYDDVEARENTIPTREQALELVARAAYLEDKNENRSRLWTVLKLFTHFKEKSTIKKLRALAEKADNVSVLETEAENENYRLARLRHEVDFSLIKAQAPTETEIDLERIQKNSEELEQYLDDVDLERIAAARDAANETLVLDDEEDALSIDDDVDALSIDDEEDAPSLNDSTLTGGTLNLETVGEEAFLSDEEAIVGDGDQEPFFADDEDKISIVVDELAEGFDNADMSERIEEREIDAKEFVIE